MEVWICLVGACAIEEGVEGWGVGGAGCLSEDGIVGFFRYEM